MSDKFYNEKRNVDYLQCCRSDIEVMQKCFDEKGQDLVNCSLYVILCEVSVLCGCQSRNTQVSDLLLFLSCT